MAEIKITDVVINIREAEKCFAGQNKRDIQFPVLKLQEGNSKARIFNEGKASDNTSLGAYKNARYKAFRQSIGRQTGYKDLEVFGDLRRNFTVGTNGDDIVLGFATDKARLIAVGQEQQTGKEIWKPTKEEINDIKKAAVKRIRECLRKSFKK